ncbi:hypothetical protein CHS0354_012131 [Potamilus streckersoni]|uniref:CUB domain-containing protein n=1 Tax=Potamilus streckersoni TaxID=2493646 RepID=A0AAE0SAD3_9BIVA|nr:hypothetical protein CHS0354_012131 [Potamilus streckersoni]
MWFTWLPVIFCGLVLLQTLKIEEWSGHVCVKYFVTYLNERYCYSANDGRWTGEHACKEWRARPKSRTHSVRYCCDGWEHNGNQLCNIRKDDGIKVSTDGDGIETLTHSEKAVLNTKHKTLIKRQGQVCGGHFSANTWKATLTSPNYPNQYENNLCCNWIIEASTDYIISLRIKYIDFEHRGNCLFDYLKINLGNALETNRICMKSNTDLIFISRSSEADITFVTDGSKTRTGFSLEYQAVRNCGGYLTAQTQARILKPPNYPYQYENNLYCHWTIEAGMNYRISIRITYLDLEETTICRHNYLQIYLGTTPIMGTERMCRKSNTDMNFISSSQQVAVILVTDRPITTMGFSLEYQAIVVNCGRYLTAETSTTTLTSPYYPSQYENNLQCYWIIQAPMNYKIVIRIINIDLQQSGNCLSDYLILHLGTNNDTDRICMNTDTDSIFISVSNKADVTFVTDGSIANTGFLLEYQAVEPCGGYITAEVLTTTLNSPSPPLAEYPYRYSSNLFCNWSIHAERNHRIAIRITDIVLDENGNCVSDYLKIYLGRNGVYATDRICTKSNKELFFISESNKADVLLVTGRLTPKTGFSLQYQAVSTCGGNLTAQIWRTTLTSPSPNFPDHFEHNLYCNWTIEAPVNYTIVIQIMEIDLEQSENCSFNYLEVNLGNNNYHRICRKNSTDLFFISMSNKVDVMMVTDGSPTTTDFYLQYNAVPICGSNLTVLTGITTLTSPNYPNQYENNLRCHWIIHAPMNHRIAIQITDIDLQQSGTCSFDYLKINLGGNSDLETDRICMKNDTDLIFFSRSNTADVYFITDQSITKRGFSLHYQAGTCSCEDGSGDKDCFVNLDKPLQNASESVNNPCGQESLVSQQKPEKATWIIISVVGFVVVLIIAGIYCWCRRRKKLSRRDNKMRQQGHGRELTEMQEEESLGAVYTIFPHRSQNSR